MDLRRRRVENVDSDAVEKRAGVLQVAGKVAVHQFEGFGVVSTAEKLKRSITFLDDENI